MQAKKTVLITGGARRFGAELVKAFAAGGWQVLFTARHSFDEGVRLAQSLGDDVRCIKSDMSNQQSAALVAKWAAKHTDGLDLVVCNASTIARKSIAETTPDDFKSLLESNLLGAFFLAQQCLPLLRQANGSIINIADAQALDGVAGFTAYCAAKAGLISITKGMAVELAPHVRVNAVLPGTMPWPESSKEYPAQVREEMIAKIPMLKAGGWADMVSAVRYLADAPFVTGTCLVVDGGRTATH